MSDLRQMHVMAEEYVTGRHWPIVIIPPVNGHPTKIPTGKRWQENLLQPGAACSVLKADFNVGLLLRDLADVDLDCAEARSAASLFLNKLPTGLIYGRTSSPASHLLYRLSSPLPYKKFLLPGDDRGALVELRVMQPPKNGTPASAFQSVLPPSTHPEGETYTWSKFEDAALVDSKELWRALHLIAITAALAKLHPAMDDEHKAARDEYRLTISGVLARRLPHDEALNVFIIALRAAGDRKDRKSIFHTTVQKLRNGAAVKGIPTFIEMVGDKAAPAVAGWIDEIAGHAEPREPGDESETGAVENVIVEECFEDMEAKAIDWDWDLRIPKGKLTLFTGNPDVGKTTVACAIVAAYTKKIPWPDGAPNDADPGDVLMLIAEDDPRDTIKPRLLAAGADVRHVHLLRGVQVKQGAKQIERELALDQDLALLENTLASHKQTRLVMIDPITNYFGHANVNKDQEIRRVLVPIKNVAERTGVTFIGVGHFNKRDGVAALQRISGGVAFPGVARATWMFAKNPEADGEYLMLLVKGNLTKRRDGLRYRIVEKIIPLPNEKQTGVPVIDWLGKSETSADSVVETAGNPEEKKKAKAKRFLLDFLANGDQPSETIIAEGAKQGIGRSNLFDAKKELGIRAYKDAGCWWWPTVQPSKGDA